MRRRTCSDIEDAEEFLDGVLVFDDCACSFVGVGWASWALRAEALVIFRREHGRLRWWDSRADRV
jgi:hypothetical protein